MTPNSLPTRRLFPRTEVDSTDVVLSHQDVDQIMQNQNRLIDSCLEFIREIADAAKGGPKTFIAFGETMMGHSILARRDYLNRRGTSGSDDKQWGPLSILDPHHIPTRHHIPCVTPSHTFTSPPLHH